MMANPAIRPLGVKAAAERVEGIGRRHFCAKRQRKDVKYGMATPTTFDGGSLAADLQSEDPARVQRALEALDRSWKEGRFATLPAPAPTVLEAFGDVPASIIETYLSVLENYPAFSPDMSPSELRHAMLEAVVGYGGGNPDLARIVALHVRTTFQPRDAVLDSLDWVAHCGLDEQAVVRTATELVDSLLDDLDTRPATVAAMRRWATLDELPEVIEAARPRLSDEERAQLVVDDD